jgi:4-hydroxymandelate oxidase
VSAPSLATSLLGSPLATPVGLAPVAYHRLAHPEGEVAAARAAGGAGALFVVSFFASRTLEDIAAAATGPLWLQLYWLKQRSALATLASRAADAGYRALVLTVDAAKVGRRLRDLRNSFSVPPDVHAANIPDSVTAVQDYGAPGASAIEAQSREQFDTSITWADLAWLRDRSPLPLVIKGLLTAEDARLAVEHGADAIAVSNHGGRQLDGAVPSLAALPEIVAAVDGAVPVIYDGGVRRGADVVTALALGARAVLIGRPMLWGLAYGGEAGVARVLELMRTELEDALILTGRPRLADLGPDLLAPWPQ